MKRTRDILADDKTPILKKLKEEADTISLTPDERLHYYAGRLGIEPNDVLSTVCAFAIGAKLNEVEHIPDWRDAVKAIDGWDKDQDIVECVKKNDPSMNHLWVLSWAAEQGSEEAIKELLNTDNFDPTEDEGDAFITAVDNDQWEIIRLFLKDGRPDPSAGRNAAIRKAAEDGLFDIVSLLLQDERVNPCDVDDAAVKEATNNGHFEVAKLLLNSKWYK